MSYSTISLIIAGVLFAVIIAVVVIAKVWSKKLKGIEDPVKARRKMKKDAKMGIKNSNSQVNSSTMDQSQIQPQANNVQPMVGNSQNTNMQVASTEQNKEMNKTQEMGQTKEMDKTQEMGQTQEISKAEEISKTSKKSK